MTAILIFGGGLSLVQTGDAKTRCAATTVQYRPAPTETPRGVGGPWVATTNSAFRGYLFYFGATRWMRSKPHGVRIFTTKAHERVYPKVLWLALGRSTAAISIHGTRLDRSGSFTSRYPGVGGGQYPSYVEVPTAGCWRVSVTSGRLKGSVTFLATDAA